MIGIKLNQNRKFFTSQKITIIDYEDSYERDSFIDARSIIWDVYS